MSAHHAFVIAGVIMMEGCFAATVPVKIKPMTHSSSSDITSFDKGIWRHLPPLCRDILILMRMDRPIGWWLLVLPAWIAMPVATRLNNIPAGELFRLMGLFLIGAIIMRGTGCIVNDLWDRDIDPQVKRTSGRPIAAQRISVGLALMMIVILALIGFLVLIQLPMQAVWIGIAALPLIIAYPLAKRLTGYPQIILGITYSWGVLLGWAAVGVWPDSRVIWLYLAMACWTFGYDTIYAIQDMADDDYDDMKSEVMGAVAENFRPEFINRIDESVVFHPLGADHIRAIAKIQLHGLAERLQERELTLEITDAVFEQLSRVGFDPVFGARPLKRAIQQLVENPLAQAILEGQFSPGDRVYAALDGASLKFASEALLDRAPEAPVTKSLH